MAHLKAYIPACEAYGWSGGPGFKTTIVEMTNGRERRNAQQAQPRHRYILPYANIPPSTYAGIKQLHLTAMGMLHAFLYQDVLDYTASNETFAIAEAGQQEFQLAKTSEVDGVFYQRKVFALYSPDPTDPGSAIPTAPQIRVNNATSGGWTFDYDRGIAIAPAPMSGGEVLSWTGEFSLWVRFNQDDMPMSIDNKRHDGYAINGQVEIIEVAAPMQELS